jgi:hypothetical protein
MSEIPAGVVRAPLAAANIVPFEQRLFERSPVGVLPTAIGIFVMFMASFEGLAFVTGYPLADQLSLSPREGAWPAAVLSLMAAVALGMQRYTRLKDLEDAPALSRLMPCDLSNVMRVETAVRRRLLWGSLSGAILGGAASFVAVPDGVLQRFPMVFLWFTFTMASLGALFGRGGVMTRVSARHFADRIDLDLKIDLLRINELSVIGRSSARTSLIWFTVAAVICLFFASGHAPALVIGTVAIAAGMGLWIFFGSLERVHRRIHAAKLAELDHVRHAIADARLQAVHDHEAATRLHGLLAYETRIEAVHEWPFDQMTLLRVGTYVLIPAIPWFGEALVNYLVERIAH